MEIKLKKIITIDDGPSNITHDKLEYLSAKNLKAIWFCTGSNLEKHFEIAVEILNRGHQIGNHSWSHARFSEISTTQCFREIISTEIIIDKVYAKAGVVREGKCFRFPYGDQGLGKKISAYFQRYFSKKYKLIQLLLKNQNMKKMTDICYNLPIKPYLMLRRNNFDWLWTDDSYDWKTGAYTEDQLLSYFNNFSNLFKNKNHDSVVLFHDKDELKKQFKLGIDAALRYN